MIARVRRTPDQLIADLDDLDTRFSALVASCSREQLAWHTPAAWSIAECIQHVALANSQYLGAIRVALDRKNKLPTSQATVLSTAGWFSSYFVTRVIGPELRGRFKAPKTIRPTPVDASEALQGLLGTHQQIHAVLASGSKVNLNKIRFKNPFFPIIRFTVATALLIMAAHERRHLLQAERVQQEQGFPNTNPQEY